jgi:hypothetical protein
MPNLINNGDPLSANYRKSAPSTRFGTPELVHLQITFNDLDMTDYDTVDGNFNKVVMAVQQYAEIYAIGEAQYGGNTSHITFLVKADTVTDPEYVVNSPYVPENPNSITLDSFLTNQFDQSVNVTYTTMYGLGYD